MVLSASEGHTYTGPIDNGYWVDAQHLKPGYRLLGVLTVANDNLPVTGDSASASDAIIGEAANDNAALALWVHNADCLGKDWVPLDIGRSDNWNGCEACARWVRRELGGGEVRRIEPRGGTRFLGGYRGVNPIGHITKLW